MIRIVFVGFRHSHILGLYREILKRPDMDIVACCEEDSATRIQIPKQQDIAIAYDDFDPMLDKVECDVVAIGDAFGRRGQLAIKALQCGKHIIADKPICTSMKELEQIEQLAVQKRLSIGCMMDLRSHGAFIRARELIMEGKIGEIQTVSFFGQHPLLFGTRPAWYFEPAMHGGTINDIAVHAIDAITWLTGLTMTEIVAARCWNQHFKDAPHFQVAAQMLARMSNDAGVMGDVSYLAPSECGYQVPQYWRFTFHGTEGMLEFGYNMEHLHVATHRDKKIQRLQPAPDRPHAYLEDFLSEYNGCSKHGAITTEQVLYASKICLKAQQIADFPSADIPVATNINARHS